MDFILTKTIKFLFWILAFSCHFSSPIYHFSLSIITSSNKLGEYFYKENEKEDRTSLTSSLRSRIIPLEAWTKIHENEKEDRRRLSSSLRSPNILFEAWTGIYNYLFTFEMRNSFCRCLPFKNYEQNYTFLFQNFGLYNQKVMHK